MTVEVGWPQGDRDAFTITPHTDGDSGVFFEDANVICTGDIHEQQPSLSGRSTSPMAATFAA